MSGISALKSKIKSLLSKTNPEVRKVSVVYFDLDGNIDWPENCNDKVLAVPKPMTEVEWEKAASDYYSNNV